MIVHPAIQTLPCHLSCIFFFFKALPNKAVSHVSTYTSQIYTELALRLGKPDAAATILRSTAAKKGKRKNITLASSKTGFGQIRIRGFLCFHTNCENICSSSLKNIVGSLALIPVSCTVSRASFHSSYGQHVAPPRGWGHMPNAPRFPGPPLRRTRGPDPSSKATLCPGRILEAQA